jgi:hypothetical protein
LPIGQEGRIIMKKSFFEKVAAATSTVRTGRYSYEYDKKRKAVHVTDSKGIVDKWVTLADCEPDTTPKATPAPKEETVTLTKGELESLIAQAVAQAMAKTAPVVESPVVESATVVESAPKKKAARAEKDNKYARTNKSDLSKSTQQVWDAIKKAIPAATIVAYGSWLYITGTVKEDWATLKQYGCRWSRRRNCAYFVGELAA